MNNLRRCSSISTLALAAVISTGCASSSMSVTDVGASQYAPEFSVAISELLPADIPEPTYVDLPSGDKWPRTMRGGGPLVATVTFAPYVGMLGTMADIDRADDGSGFGVAFAYRLAASESTTFDVGVGYEMSNHASPATDLDATATRTCLRATLSMNKSSKLQPFVAGGAGSYALEFDGLDSEFAFTGTGGFVGGGIDYVPTGGVAIRFDIGVHVWDAADSSGGGGMTETLVVGLGASFGF